MRAQQMPKRRQSIGRAFERAGEFEHRQRGFEIEFPGQNFRRYRALGRVRLVLDIDEPADSRQSILGIDAVSVRYFRRGSDANRCGFGARDRSCEVLCLNATVSSRVIPELTVPFAINSISRCFGRICVSSQSVRGDGENACQ